LISLLKHVLPAAAVDRLRSLRKALRRLRFHTRKVAGVAVVDRAAIRRALERLGIPPGADILVHSSMRGLGVIEGGAPAAVAALLDAIGPEGTLLVPAYSFHGSMVEHLARGDIALDAASSPSTMGRISETVRTMPGALRSLHPTHSVAALGPRAAWYTEGHESCATPCGPASPFRRLVERPGWIVCLGSPIGKVTSYHAFEDECPDFPLPVYLDRDFPVTMIAQDGRRVTTRVKCHDPAVAARRIDNTRDIEAALEKIFTRMGVLVSLPLGAGAVSAMRADRLHAALAVLVREGTTIYGIGRTRLE
jgi:aminoglycoside 3-N-acetyltransferase